MGMQGPVGMLKSHKYLSIPTFKDAYSLKTWYLLLGVCKKGGHDWHTLILEFLSSNCIDFFENCEKCLLIPFFPVF